LAQNSDNAISTCAVDILRADDCGHVLEVIFR